MTRRLPTISIVMPLRDAAGTLPAALESLRKQTFAGWELLAVNDGSADETAAMLESAARADERIRVLSQTPLGIVAALQRGCAAARSEFVARMDGDDVMSPPRLERQLEFLRAHRGTGVVSCRVRFGGNAQAQAGYAEHVAWINSLISPKAIALRRFVESPVAHPSVMFRRELLDRHGGYRAGDFPEDYELWLRWMEAGVRFAKVEEPLLVWNDPPKRLSRTCPRYRPEAFYRLKCVYVARWLKTRIEPSREIWLWGAGRITRRRFHTLETESVSLAGFIDVDRRKIGRTREGRPVVGPRELPPKERAFILVGVSVRGARALITAELEQDGRIEGIDYLLVA